MSVPPGLQRGRQWEEEEGRSAPRASRRLSDLCCPQGSASRGCTLLWAGTRRVVWKMALLVGHGCLALLCAPTQFSLLTRGKQPREDESLFRATGSTGQSQDGIRSFGLSDVPHVDGSLRPRRPVGFAAPLWPRFCVTSVQGCCWELSWHPEFVVPVPVPPRAWSQAVVLPSP